jgi:hypothetical protein
MSSNPFIKAAKNYLKKGISVVPTDKHKRPTYEWFKFQKHRMSEDSVEECFAKAEGIGIICGSISGGILAIDIDSKYFDNEISYEEIWSRIPDEIKNLLVVQETRSGGKHWIFKTEYKLGNVKLAMRPTSDVERIENPNEKMKVLIETRGEGGFICITPTEAYSIISENKKLNTLTTEQTIFLLELSTSYNRVWDEAELYNRFSVEKENKFLTSPFDDADEKMNLLSYLQTKGYTPIGRESAQGLKLKRPGTSTSSHSGYYHSGTNRYANFSMSNEFENGKVYSPSAIFTILECGGDWKKSYKMLLDMGYGHSIDLTKQLNEFITAYNNKELSLLLKYHFDATEVLGGWIINNKFYKNEY